MKDSMQTELMHKRWEKEFDKLEDEIEWFRTYFANVKECKCKIEKCRHYKRARHKIFGNRIDELYNLRLQIGFRVYRETIHSDNGSKSETLWQ